MLKTCIVYINILNDFWHSMAIFELKKKVKGEGGVPLYKIRFSIVT